MTDVFQRASKWLIALIWLCLLVFIFILSAQTAGAETCAYHDRDVCVPALISNETWFTPAPDHIVGKAVWYAPRLMQATAEFRGQDLSGFKGGVSLFSPADIGQVVWLKRPGHPWEGPYLVVDCSQRTHMYTTLTYVKEAVEVDFDTALRWGMVSGDENGYTVNEWMIRDVQVYKGLTPPRQPSEPVVYSDWFAQTMAFDYHNSANRRWKPEMMAYTDSESYLHALYTSVMAFSSLPSAANPKSPEDALSGLPVAFWGLEQDFSPVPDEMPTFEPAEEPLDLIPNVQITPEEAHIYDMAHMAAVTITPQRTWEVDCTDGNAYTGFDMFGTCIPGVISEDTWMLPYPEYTAGPATYYASGLMEQVARNRGLSLKGYKGGVVLMTCGQIGQSVWLRLNGGGWEGPYRVVDCSQPFHLWLNLIQYGNGIELPYEVWQGANAGNGVWAEVCLHSSCSGTPWNFAAYWAEHTKYLVPKE